MLPILAEEHDVTALVAEETEPAFRSRYDFEVRPVLPSVQELYYPVGFFRHVLSIRRHIGEPDVVHSFVAHPYLPVAAVSLLGRETTLTATAAGTYAVQPLTAVRSRYILWFGYRQADAVFCISDYTEQSILDHVDVDTTSVVPLGVDLDQYGEGEIGEDGYILSVGALKQRKGQDVLAEAFTRIAEEFPEISLKIVGPVQNDRLKSKIESLASGNGLSERIHILGKVDQDRLAELYRRCSFFALTPRVVGSNAFEGFGLVYLEAAAYGKPSVGTRSGGVPTAVDHERTGLLAPEDDVEAIADHLRTLLADDDRRRSYGQNARKKAEVCTWHNYVDQLYAAWP